jgi:hypothetical protein
VSVIGELRTLLEARPSDSGASAEVSGWARWVPVADLGLCGELPPAESVEFEASVDDQAVLARMRLASDRHDLSALNALRGSSALSGFRRRLAEQTDRTPGALLTHRLLDDLPILLRVAGQARLVEHPALIRLTPNPPPLAAGTQVPGADQCEGWRSDGTLVARIIDSGGALTMGLGEPTSPTSEIWPESEPLPAMATRRRRRVVLRRESSASGEAAAAPTVATVYFRDSYADPDGVERGLHSYRVQVEIDDRGVIGAIDAQGLILPWPECWAAASNATVLRGASVTDIETRSKQDLVGRGTCTHLTDTLRSLRHVAAFAGARE